MPARRNNKAVLAPQNSFFLFSGRFINLVTGRECLSAARATQFKYTHAEEIERDAIWRRNQFDAPVKYGIFRRGRKSSSSVPVLAHFSKPSPEIRDGDNLGSFMLHAHTTQGRFRFISRFATTPNAILSRSPGLMMWGFLLSDDETLFSYTQQHLGETRTHGP